MIEARAFVKPNAKSPMRLTLPGIVTEVRPLKKNAIPEMDVTPAGISTVPEQLEFPVTTLSKMVNEPDVPQSTTPLVPL